MPAPSGWTVDTSAPQQTSVIGTPTMMTLYKPVLPSCVTQAQRDQAAQDCRWQLRGLGSYTSGPFSGLDPCDIAKLPVCVVKVGMTVQAAQAPPKLQAAPTSFTQMTPMTPSAAPPPTYAVIPAQIAPVAPTSSGWSTTTVGLAALILAGGGYLAYRTLRKKKPATMASNPRRRRRLRRRRR